MTPNDDLVSSVENLATVTMSQGDILGTLLIFLPALVGVMLLISMVMFCMVGERPKGWEWLPPVVMIGTCALTGWGLWEIAHWLAA